MAAMEGGPVCVLIDAQAWGDTPGSFGNGLVLGAFRRAPTRVVRFDLSLQLTVSLHPRSPPEPFFYQGAPRSPGAPRCAIELLDEISRKGYRKALMQVPHTLIITGALVKAQARGPASSRVDEIRRGAARSRWSCAAPST